MRAIYSPGSRFCLLLVGVLATTDALSLRQRCGARPSWAKAVLSCSRPALPAHTAPAAAAAAVLLHADAAFAATSDVPDNDIFVVGAALLLVVLTGLLQLSLGDIQAEEARLPSSVSLINKNRQKTNSFIKSKK